MGSMGWMPGMLHWCVANYLLKTLCERRHGRVWLPLNLTHLCCPISACQKHCSYVHLFEAKGLSHHHLTSETHAVNCITCSFCPSFLAPAGNIAPRLTGSDLSRVTGSGRSDLALQCPLQGHPLPSHR